MAYNAQFERRIADVVKQALNAEIRELARDIEDEAIEKLRDKITEVVAKVCIKTEQYVTLHNDGTQLTIGVKLDGSK
jgi:tRNA pseudouridine-54 N-methylase